MKQLINSALLTISVLSFHGHIVVAQPSNSDITYRLGSFGKKISIDTNVHYNISRGALDKDSRIYISSNTNQCTVTGYDVEVLLERGEPYSPDRVKSNDALEVENIMNRKLKAGDVIYISNLSISCTNNPTNINPEKMAIHIRFKK